MSQDFRPHPVFVNYEASRDGVVRHRILKRPVGWKNNMGYLMFSVGKKKYLCHMIVFEAFNGLIKDGLVIDHIDSDCPINRLDKLEAVTQSENNRRGKTGKHAKFAKGVISFDTVTHEQKVFQSIKQAGEHFDICRPSVRFVAERVYRTSTSKLTGHKNSVFRYQRR